MVSNLLVNSFERSARRYWLHYVIAGAGGLFVAAALGVDPRIDCRDYPCPGWLLVAVGLVGALFATGGLYAIIRNWHWGSRIDFATDEVVWWACYPPIQENRISIREIGEIRIDRYEGVIGLYDLQGQWIHLPEECIPSPLPEWAEELGKRFPNIRIVEGSPFFRS